MKQAYIIAGPNGSGKSTLAGQLIPELGVTFINADEIALRLAPAGDLAGVRLPAGKEFFGLLEQCLNSGQSFAIETTLSGRYLVRHLKKFKRLGYQITLIYIYLDNPEEAINRIKIRVKQGGHSVPDEDVIRRFARGMNNFWHIYKPLVVNWRLVLNSKEDIQLIATGDAARYNIVDEDEFARFCQKLSSK